METVPFPAAEPGPALCVEPATTVLSEERAEDLVDSGAGLAALDFAGYSRLYVSWAEGEISDSQVLQQYGRALDLMQNQWAVEGDTQCEGQRVGMFVGLGDEALDLLLQPSVEERMGLPFPRDRDDEERLLPEGEGL